MADKKEMINFQKKGNSLSKSAPFIPFKQVSNKKFFLISTLLLICISFAIYSNSINNEFTNWDDGGLVVNNTSIRSLDLKNLKNIFYPSGSGTYQPMRVFGYAIDYHFWKLNPVGYHLHNILFHTLATIFLFFALTYALPQIIDNANRKKTQNCLLPDKTYRVIALLTAIIFMVHPVNVEAVTWLSSRKYVYLAFFTFLAFFLFIKSSENEKYHLFFALTSVICTVLAVMSSPFAIAIPGLFFLYDYCRDTSNNPFAVLKKRVIYFIPYFIFCLIMYPYLWKALGSNSRIEQLDIATIIDICKTMIRCLFDYTVNLTCPLWLNARYPDYTSGSFSEPKIIAVLIAILLISAIAVWQAHKGKKILLFCLGWFVIAWLPASNIVPISIKMADRYIYIATVGPCLYFVYGSIRLFCYNKNFKFCFLAYGIIFFIIIFFSILTVQRNKIWANSITLWTDSVKTQPVNPLPQYSLASALSDAGDIDGAIYHYLKAIKLDPEHFGAHSNIGILYFKKKQYNKAISHFDTASALLPNSIIALKNLGFALYKTGKFEESIFPLTDILRLTPEDGFICHCIGTAYFKLKEYQNAFEYLDKAVQFNPENYNYHCDLAGVCWKLDRKKEAVIHYKDALKLKPDLKEAKINLDILEKLLRK